MLQDPTEQVDIDNFMVQQLDGTSNKWGWCKQKYIMDLILMFLNLICDFL
jgi:enolase